MALLWAAGIIWFAYDFAGSAPQAVLVSNDASPYSASVRGACPRSTELPW